MQRGGRKEDRFGRRGEVGVIEGFTYPGMTLLGIGSVGLHDREDIQGFDQVLNYFGQYGWELVSVEPQMWEALNYAEHNMGQVPPSESGSLQMYRTTGWAVGGYNCFFRRRG